MTRHAEPPLVGLWRTAGDRDDLDRFDAPFESIVVDASLGLSTDGVRGEREARRRAPEAVPESGHEAREVVEPGSTVAACVVVTGTFALLPGDIPRTWTGFRTDRAVIAGSADGRIVEAREAAGLLLVHDSRRGGW